MLESKYAKGNSYFITLTFDDNLVQGTSLASELSKPFLTNFIKLLRRRWEYHNFGIFRFAAVGEYGEKFDRAHYHLALFGVPFNFTDMYTLMSDCWKYGFITISPFSDGRAMYVGKYSVKALFEDCPRKVKPFLFQSNNLGKLFLNDEKAVNLLRTQQRFYLTSSNGSVYNLPRYFRNRIFSAFDIYTRNNLLAEENYHPIRTYNDWVCFKSKIKQYEQSESLFYKRLRESRQVQTANEK